MASVFGIDVSGWVASPDWGAVSNQGVKFVFVKASENTLADTKFSQHWQGSKSVGMLRGHIISFIRKRIIRLSKPIRSSKQWVPIKANCRLFWISNRFM